MLKLKRILFAVLAAGLMLMSCEPEETIIVPISTNTPDEHEEPQKPDEKKDSTGTQTPPVQSTAVIPVDMKVLPSVYIETPGKKEITSKIAWIENSHLVIKGEANKTLYQDDSLKIRGRGNSTWWYEKKPYSIKLDHQADLLGTGKSKKWVLLANWMDRTLLRNQVAFEAARMTSMRWNPSGRFVEFYLNNKYLGVYWLGEKIEVEGSKFKADFLYSFDTSDGGETDFKSSGTYMANSSQWGAPVDLKYPDEDDYEEKLYAIILDKAKKTLDGMTDDIAAGGLSKIDVDSFCDWYLVHELCYNLEPNHPKSCFFHWRDGKMHAGPIWDFDWHTFVPNQNWLGIKKSLWFDNLLKNDAFKKRLKERWTELKPKFETLPDYIDAQAEIIREAEAANHNLWPCDSSTVNGDETLTFQEAIDRMKLALTQRITYMDKAIPAL